MNPGLRAWPIVVGLLVDLVGSLFLGLGYSIVKVGTNIAAGGGAADQIVLTATEYLITAVFGLLLVVAGGYVAGRMARVRPATHGLCVGIGLLLVTLIIEALSPDPAAPLWFNVVSIVGVVPAATMGGRLAKRSTRANTPPQPTSGVGASS
jgi:hypothetical protein